ncbi:MAG: fibronectin type III domain-containing protein [bacterium]
MKYLPILAFIVIAFFSPNVAAAESYATYPDLKSCVSACGGKEENCALIKGLPGKTADSYQCTVPVTTQTPAPSPTPTPPSSAKGSSFVPLAAVPGLTDVNPNNLAEFFNGLYKFCIGAAAVLAILMITLGGFKVMSGDSITAHSEGRDQIGGAIIGLVLVLAPFLVFSIINPDILSLKINTYELQPTNSSNTGGGTGSPDGTQVGGGNTGGDGDGTGTVGDTAPQSLTVTAQTLTSVTLTWKAPPSGTAPAAYDVYDNGTLAQSVAGTTATVSKLAAGSDHSFTVKARDASGVSSSASNAVSVKIGAAGYYVFTWWHWYDDEAIVSNDKSRALMSCWVYGGGTHLGASANWIKTPDTTEESPRTPVDTKSFCAKRLQEAQQSAAKNVSAYPGYKANVYDLKCDFTSADVDEIVPASAAPGKVCDS